MQFFISYELQWRMVEGNASTVASLLKNGRNSNSMHALEKDNRKLRVISQLSKAMSKLEDLLGGI